MPWRRPARPGLVADPVCFLFERAAKGKLSRRECATAIRAARSVMRSVGEFGGLARNRTGVQGFAVLCVTTPPRGLPQERAAARSREPAITTCRRRLQPPTARDEGRRRIPVHRFRKGLRSRRGVVIRRPLIPDSSAVEQSTVNRLVAGSNPAPGASIFRGLGGHHPGPFCWLGSGRGNAVSNASRYAAQPRAARALVFAPQPGARSRSTGMLYGDFTARRRNRHGGLTGIHPSSDPTIDRSFP